MEETSFDLSPPRPHLARLTGYRSTFPPDLGPPGDPCLTSSFFLPPVKRHRSTADTSPDTKATSWAGGSARLDPSPCNATCTAPAGLQRGRVGVLPSQAWGRRLQTGLPPAPVHRTHPSVPHPRLSALPESRKDLYPAHLAFWCPECLHISSPDISRLWEKALLSCMTCEPKSPFSFASKHYYSF